MVTSDLLDIEGWLSLSATSSPDQVTGFDVSPDSIRSSAQSELVQEEGLVVPSPNVETVSKFDLACVLLWTD